MNDKLDELISIINNFAIMYHREYFHVIHNVIEIYPSATIKSLIISMINDGQIRLTFSIVPIAYFDITGYRITYITYTTGATMSVTPKEAVNLITFIEDAFGINLLTELPEVQEYV